MPAMRASSSARRDPIRRCRASCRHRCSHRGHISKAKAARGMRAIARRSMAASTSTRDVRFLKVRALNEATAKGGHAALMDQVYRRQRFIYDLTRKYYLFGRDRMIREPDLTPGARLVEIGCGTARNLVKFAKHYPQARLFGLDASNEMLKSANASVARAGLSNRILLAHGYAEALSPEMFGEHEPFDV